MDITDRKKFYRNNYSIGYFGDKFTDRVAVIAMLMQVYNRLKEKNPLLRLEDLIKKLDTKHYLTKEATENLALICENIAYGCKEFPTFDLQLKDMPAQISDIFMRYTPF